MLCYYLLNGTQWKSLPSPLKDVSYKKVCVFSVENMFMIKIWRFWEVSTVIQTPEITALDAINLHMHIYEKCVFRMHENLEPLGLFSNVSRSESDQPALQFFVMPQERLWKIILTPSPSVMHSDFWLFFSNMYNAATSVLSANLVFTACVLPTPTPPRGVDFMKQNGCASQCL